MPSVNYENVLKLVEQLPEYEQNRLIAHLHTRQIIQQTAYNPTREELILELEHLRSAGAFENAGSLYGVFANPDAPDISEADLHAQLHAIATEWEQELDEFYTDDH